MRRAKVHSAGRFQSLGRGMASPYSTEGYWRNARWANPLSTIPANTTGPAIFQKCRMPEPPAFPIGRAVFPG